MGDDSLFEELLRKRSGIPFILWAALTGSMLIYLYFAYTMASENEPAELDGVFVTSIATVAIVTGVISIGIRLWLGSESTLGRFMEKTNPDPTAMAKNQQTGTVDPKMQEQYEKLNDKQRRALSISAAIFTPMILRLALNESIVIYGLILSFMSNRVDIMLPFLIAGVLLNLPDARLIPSCVERAMRLP